MQGQICSRLARPLQVCRVAAIVVIAVLCNPTSTQSQTVRVGNGGDASQERERPANAGTASVTGSVLNERLEPVARVRVQAFSPRTTIPDVHAQQNAPSSRASGSASTDAEGRF